MNYAMNLEPHIAALLFLGTVALLVLLVVAAIVFSFRRRDKLRHALAAIAVLVLGYGALLLVYCAFSRERILGRGEEKYFCELDCHIAYSVQNVQRTKSIGSTTADGEFYVVTVRVRFDETTIAAWRPRDAPLPPNPRLISLVADCGPELGPSSAGQRAWEQIHGPSASLSEPLRPGESYQTMFVFDVPTGLQYPKLLVSSRGFPMPVLIGDESSVLHKKTYFRL